MQRLLFMNSLQHNTTAHICLSDHSWWSVQILCFQKKLSFHNDLKIPCSDLNMQHNFCKENIHIRNISLVYLIDYIVPNAIIFKYIFSVIYYITCTKIKGGGGEGDASLPKTLYIFLYKNRKYQSKMCTCCWDYVTNKLWYKKTYGYDQITLPGAQRYRSRRLETGQRQTLLILLSSSCFLLHQTGSPNRWPTAGLGVMGLNSQSNVF